MFCFGYVVSTSVQDGFSISLIKLFSFFFEVEDNFQEGQEKEDEQDKENIKSEDNAIEMSEDFNGQMHDGDENKAGQLDEKGSTKTAGAHLEAVVSVFTTEPTDCTIKTSLALRNKSWFC